MKSRAIAALLFIGAVAPWHSRALASTEIAMAFFAEARTAFEKQDYSKARALFERSLAEGMEGSAIHYNIGAAAYLGGDLPRAERAFREVARNPSMAALAHYNLGLVAMERRDDDEAREWFERAAAMPGAPEWIKPLAGLTLAQGGDRQGARQLLTELLTSNEAYIRTAAERSLAQLQTLDLIDDMQARVEAFRARTGRYPADWRELGTASGLPGIPLAIARPDWRVTVNDSIEKKAAFLRQAKIELGLENLEVHEGRAERWSPEPRFHLVISRAFAELHEFLAQCAHLVEPTGWLAAMKGARPADDAGGQVIALRVPFLDAERHLVLCPAR